MTGCGKTGFVGCEVECWTAILAASSVRGKRLLVSITMKSIIYWCICELDLENILSTRLRWEDCVKRDVRRAGEEEDWKKKTRDR